MAPSLSRFTNPFNSLPEHPHEIIHYKIHSILRSLYAGYRRFFS
jgi:hypothetical protein